MDDEAREVELGVRDTGEAEAEEEMGGRSSADQSERSSPFLLHQSSTLRPSDNCSARPSPSSSPVSSEQNGLSHRGHSGPRRCPSSSPGFHLCGRLLARSVPLIRFLAPLSILPNASKCCTPSWQAMSREKGKHTTDPPIHANCQAHTSTA